MVKSVKVRLVSLFLKVNLTIMIKIYNWRSLKLDTEQTQHSL